MALLMAAALMIWGRAPMTVSIRSGRSILHQAIIGKAVITAGSNDQVVLNRDVQEAPALNQLPCQSEVLSLGRNCPLG